jgi:hypothetical protein
MNNKILYLIIVVLLVLVVGGGIYFFYVKQESAPATTPEVSNQTPAAVVSTNGGNLSEQPNQAKFDEYLTKANLGKFPVNEEFNPFKVVPATVFTSADQFCTSLDIKKTIPSGSFSVAVYDTVKKDYLQPKAVFPVEFKKGGSIGCSGGSEYPMGKYEYKIYIDDVLAVVLPFEVK